MSDGDIVGGFLVRFIEAGKGLASIRWLMISCSNLSVELNDGQDFDLNTKFLGPCRPPVLYIYIKKLSFWSFQHSSSKDWKCDLISVSSVSMVAKKYQMGQRNFTPLV